MTTRVLVVDDEPQILRAMRINLTAHGYDVAVAATGAEALADSRTTPPDLMILDLGLPDLDGTEVIARLRAHSSLPILVLSGRDTSDDKIAALDAGADDYVTKPFDIGELLARVRAVTRRSGSDGTVGSVTIGQTTVDVDDRVATRDGAPVRLTPTEWQVLTVLVRNPGKLVGHRQLLREVWGPVYRRETNYLRQYVTQLRHKLETNPSRPVHLLTEPGMGYRFRP